MTILIALISLSVVGIGAVIWLLRSEKNSPHTHSLSSAKEVIKFIEEVPPPRTNAVPKPRSPRKELSLLDRLIPHKKKSVQTNVIVPAPKLSAGSVSGVLPEVKFKDKLVQPPITGLKYFIQHIQNVIVNRAILKKKQPLESQGASPLLILNDIIEEKRKEDMDNPARVDGPPIGTANIKTVPTEEKAISDEDIKRIDKEIQLTTDLNELREKYTRLDNLFIEKSSDLERVNKSLENELNHRKDFNKVKDLLEKELKESRGRTREAQQELNAARTEGEAHKKRILLLEEKVIRLEKALQEEQDTIKKLQAQSTVLTTADADTTLSAVTSEETRDPRHLMTPDNVDKDAFPNQNQTERPTPAVEEIPSSSLPLDYDTPVEGGTNGFLKLQPDVMAQSDHEKNQSPSQDSVETPQPTTLPKEIIDIIDPEKDPAQAPSPHQPGADKTDINTDKEKE